MAHIKQVVTTLATQFIRSLVCCITVSTLLKVADFPTVGDLRVKLSCWQRIGKRSKCVTRSVLWVPAGTWNHIHIKVLQLQPLFRLKWGIENLTELLFIPIEILRLFSFEDIKAGTFHIYYCVLLFAAVSVSYLSRGSLVSCYYPICNLSRTNVTSLQKYTRHGI